MALIPVGPRRRLCGAVVGALTLGVLTVAPAGAQTATVAIRSMAFAPATVQVQQVAGEPSFPAVHGHAVWTNEDQAEHTVTFDDPRVASSGRIATGQRFEAVLTLAGSFTYRCVIHPAMTGRVEVATVAGTDTKETRAADDADKGSGRSSLTPVLVGAALAVAVAVLAWLLLRRRRTSQAGPVER